MLPEVHPPRNAVARAAVASSKKAQERDGIPVLLTLQELRHRVFGRRMH